MFSQQGEPLVHQRLVFEQLGRAAAEAAAGQQLPEHHSEAVQVRRHAPLATRQALGGHVVHGSDEQGSGGRLPGLEARLGDPEVQQLHAAVGGEHDVAGLDVPVLQLEGATVRAQGSRGAVQRIRHHLHHLERHPGGHRHASSQLPKVEPLDVLHDQRPALHHPSEPVHLHDRGVTQEPEQAGLVPQPAPHLFRVLGVWPQHLEGHLLGERSLVPVAGSIDRAHASTGEELEQLVAAAGHGPPRDTQGPQGYHDDAPREP